jgi:hypothetical protein
MARNFTAASSQYLSTASAPVSGSPMTIACWFNVTAVNIQHTLCSVGVSNSSQRNQLFINSGPIQAVAVGSLATDQPSSASNATANEWNHAAGVYTSSTSRTTYRNGTAGTAGTANIGTQSTANQITIGARNNGSSIGIYANGSIAEVGIWNAALTAAEIASLADGMTCDKVRPQSLVFYAPLVRNLQDVRGGLTITNNNTATVAAHTRVYA